MRTRHRRTSSPGAPVALSTRITDRMREAGASVYAEYDRELAALLDPSGRWTACGWVLRWVGILVVGAAAAAAAAAHAPWLGMVTLLVWFGGLYAADFARVPSVLPPLLVACATADIYTSPALAGVVAALFLGWLLTHRVHRGAVLLAGYGAYTVALVGTVSPLQQRGWVAVAALAAAEVVGAWVANSRHLPRPFKRLSPSDLSLSPPPPPSRLPWLLRWQVRRATRRGAAQRRMPSEVIDSMAHRRGRRRYEAHEIAQGLKVAGKKRAGGYGERRTALLLLGLPARRGVRIVHDVDLPGARDANVDHVVVIGDQVFVLDSKQYGTDTNPVTIGFDQDRSEVCRFTQGGTYSIADKLATLTWATRAVSTVLGVQARGVMVVHGAVGSTVQHGLAVAHEEGGVADVISADMLFARIESVLNHDPARWNVVGRFRAQTRRSRLRWGLRKLRSATGDQPQVVAPLGRSGPKPPAVWDDVTPCQIIPSAHSQRPPASSAGRGGSGGKGPFDDIVANATPVIPHPPEETEGGEASDETVPVQDTRGSRDSTGTWEAAVAERWQRMCESEQEPPDEVKDSSVRAVRRGVGLEIVDMSHGTLRSTRVRAMSPPCHGPNGAFLWVCSEPDWQQYVSSRHPVPVQTISVDQVVVTEVEAS